MKDVNAIETFQIEPWKSYLVLYNPDVVKLDDLMLAFANLNAAAAFVPAMVPTITVQHNPDAGVLK